MKASCKPVKDGVKYNSLLDAVLSLDKNSFDTIIERMKDLPENNSPFIKKEFHGKVVFCNYGSGKTFASNLSRLQLKKDNFLEKVIYHVKNNPNGAFNESGRPVQYLLDSDYLFELISGYPADQFKDKNFETDYFPNMEKTAKAMKVLIKNNYTIVANVSYSRFLDNIFDKQDCSAIYNANVKELDAIVRTRAQIENKKAIDIKSIEKNVIAVSNLEGNVSSFIDITNSDKRDIASVLFEENRWSRWNLINLRVNNCIEKYGTETVQLALKDMFAKYETAIASNPNLSEEARNKFKAIDKYAIYEFLDDTKEKTLKVIREQGTLNLNDQSRKNIMRFFFDSSNIEDLKSILEACKENNVVPLVRISLKNDHDNIKIVLENLYRKKLLIPMNTSVLDTEDSFFKEKLFALPVKNDEDTINIIHEIITGTPAKLKELGGITYIDTNVATSTEFIDEEGNLKSEPTPPEKQGFIVEKPRLEKKEIPSIKINSRDKDSEAASVYADKELLQEGIKDSDIVYINTISSVSYPWQIITINALLESGNTIIIGKSNPFYKHFTEKNPFPSLIEDEITEEGRTLAVFYLPKQENSSAGIKVTTNIESTIPLSESKKKLFEDFLNSSFTEKERDKIVSASFVFQDGVTVENLKYEPGEQQKEALYKIEDFIKSDKKYFVLKGYAGTGKTTIAKIIADKLSQQGIEFFFTASTNTAAGVLKASTNQYVTTFHRLFGFRYKQGKEGGESIQSIGYDISNQEIPDNFVLLVDESSMIKEGEFEDLTNILNKKNGKVIFMGDSAQLRPVEKGENNTKSKIFRLSQEEDFNPNEDMFELTEVMRNSGAILKVATQLRGENGVSDPRIMTHSMIDEDNRGIIVTKNENKELQQYVEKILKDNNGKLDNNIFKALTFTNQRANELNKEIRQYFHNYNSKGEQPISGLPIEGDYITLNQNLEDKEHIYFAKSDTVQIKKINGIQKEEITLLKENKQVNFELTVTSYSIEKDGMTKNIKICDIDVKDTNKTPDQLEIAKRNRVTLLEYKNNSVLGVDGYSLAKQYGIFLNDDVPQVRVDSKNGKIIEDNKTKARSRTVSFGYAMTIHKSQGQTISNIVIDANDIISKTFNPEFRGELLYTAVTRAKDSVLEITSSASTMDPEKGKYENFKITTSINNQPIPTTNQERWQQVSAMYDGPYKEFASLVFQKCSDFNVNLEQVTEEFIATNTTLASRGYFRPDENTVFINQYHQNNSELLLHEAIHALTSWAIDNVNTINDYEITIAVNKIKGVYKVLRENGLYFENEKELLAELANPKVREKLKKISLLSTVVDSIKKIFNKLLGDSYSGTNDAITVLEESLSTILEKANIEQIKANTEREKNRSIIMTHLSKFSQEEQDKMPYHHLLDGRFVNDEAIDLSDAELKEIADNIGNIETKLFNYDPSNNEYDAENTSLLPDSNSNIKPGVSRLFESNPELAEIGNEQQYSEYLDSVFPDYIDNFAYEAVEELLVVNKIIDRKC